MGSVLVHGSLGTSRQGNSQLSLLPLKDKDVQRRHDEMSMRIMKLTDLTS